MSFVLDSIPMIEELLLACFTGEETEAQGETASKRQQSCVQQDSLIPRSLNLPNKQCCAALTENTTWRAATSETKELSEVLLMAEQYSIVYTCHIFFFFNIFLNKFIYLFIFRCVGSLFLCEGFL